LLTAGLLHVQKENDAQDNHKNNHKTITTATAAVTTAFVTIT